MTLLLAFLAGGAAFVLLREVAGSGPAVIAAAALTAAVMVNEAWRDAGESGRYAIDLETAEARWRAWFPEWRRG